MSLIFRFHPRKFCNLSVYPTSKNLKKLILLHAQFLSSEAFFSFQALTLIQNERIRLSRDTSTTLPCMLQHFFSDVLCSGLVTFILLLGFLNVSEFGFCIPSSFAFTFASLSPTQHMRMRHRMVSKETRFLLLSRCLHLSSYLKVDKE